MVDRTHPSSLIVPLAHAPATPPLARGGVRRDLQPRGVAPSPATLLFRASLARHLNRPFFYIYRHPRPSGNVLSRTRTHPSGVCAGAVRLRCCLRPGSQLEKSRVEARGGHLAVGARAPQWPPPARWPHGEGQRRTRWVQARSYSPGGSGRVYPSQLGQLVDIIVVICFFLSPRSSDCSR